MFITEIIGPTISTRSTQSADYRSTESQSAECGIFKRNIVYDES